MYQQSGEERKGYERQRGKQSTLAAFPFLKNVLARQQEAFGIFVPGSGIQPAPIVVEVQSLNYWTATEV